MQERLRKPHHPTVLDCFYYSTYTSAVPNHTTIRIRIDKQRTCLPFLDTYLNPIPWNWMDDTSNPQKSTN